MKLTYSFIRSGLKLLRNETIQKTSKRSYDFLPYGTLNKLPINRFRALPDNDENSFLSYMWIDGTGQDLRFKMKVVKESPKTLEGIIQ